MSIMQGDPLIFLQQWYNGQVDGEWEHTYGISITTLDNPGWALKIDLKNTSLSDHIFNEIKYQGALDSDWFSCQVKDDVFEAFSGPMRLTDVIDIFLHWAGSYPIEADTKLQNMPIK